MSRRYQISYISLVISIKVENSNEKQFFVSRYPVPSLAITLHLQMSEIREYYLTQMHKIREHYEQQRNLIMEFTINESIAQETKMKPCRTTTSGDILVKMENGNISSASIIAPEEDIYKYNDAMKNEIKKLTSLRNLHEVFLDGDKVKTMKCEYTDHNNHFDFVPKILKDELRKTDRENGKLKISPDGEEDDENTTMLPVRFPDSN